MIKALILLTLLVVAVQRPEHLLSQQPQVIDRVGTAVVTKASGGPVAIQQGLRTVSRLSSVQLQWLTVTDSSLRIVFDGPGAEPRLLDIG